MIETFHEEICKACNGTGIQHSTIKGVNIVCPVCSGTGRRHVGNMDGLPPGTYCCSK